MVSVYSIVVAMANVQEGTIRTYRSLMLEEIERGATPRKRGVEVMR